MAALATAKGVPGWAEVRSWRKAQRASLVAQCLGAGRAEREGWNSTITAHLEGLPALAGPTGTVGFYWPFKGEYDPRPLARLLHARGVRLALPVVVERARPVAFRAWWPGMRMRPGVWNIPVPDEGDWVRPEALLVPLLGFDPQGYRLGYGGGYYDRTLAAARPTPPLAIGVGFEVGRLETIHPQPHDVPMDLIVTERRVFRGSAPVTATEGSGPGSREGV
ncbi:5-formyltetrahydrofolate cyclo-ligase [Dankookia rubra]|uniref:5-formyltetrahydrofolate cyclo-ligase n=1 Tax=Dankookia rubra TaxID=1442381 RepID=A0A4R5QB52_9PROT|nr:5-formyltetrahydrofolate cyclo-ligase [Dankookia rubra]TDH59943.1 5-formyltetrahydrofolate cyclo-ligase [Dankookia rubra]